MYKDMSHLSSTNSWWLTDFTLSCYCTDQKSLQSVMRRILNLKWKNTASVNTAVAALHKLIREC